VGLVGAGAIVHKAAPSTLRADEFTSSVCAEINRTRRDHGLTAYHLPDDVIAVQKRLFPGDEILTADDAEIDGCARDRIVMPAILDARDRVLPAMPAVPAEYALLSRAGVWAAKPLNGRTFGRTGAREAAEVRIDLTQRLKDGVVKDREEFLRERADWRGRP
jgi:hypothetical protein